MKSEIARLNNGCREIPESRVNQMEEEKQRLEEEIKRRRVILESTDVEIQTINEYKQLKAELRKHHLSSEDPDKLLTVLT